MKSLYTASLLAAVTLTSSAALAEDKPAAAIYDSLPAGAFELPKTYDAPKSIAATEKVPGFFVEVPEHLKRSQDPYRYVQVFGSKEQAEQRNRGTPSTGGYLTCFTTAFPNMGSELNWSGSLSLTTTVQNYKRNAQAYGNQYGSVQLVRSERIVKEAGDRMTYEIKTAYVDAETLGVKLASSQTKELLLLKEIPGKVRVFAMKSDDAVSVVVFRERHEKERHFFGAISVMAGGNHNMSSGEGCPVSFQLKTGRGVNTASTIHLESVLDISASDGDEDAEDSEQDEAGGAISGKLRKFRPASRRLVPAFNQLEAKVRPLRIGISSTWMSQDTKPVLSISHGWSGRERTQAI